MTNDGLNTLVYDAENHLVTAAAARTPMTEIVAWAARRFLELYRNLFVSRYL